MNESSTPRAAPIWTGRFAPGPWTITAVAAGFLCLFGGQFFGLALQSALGLPNAWAIVVAGFGFVAIGLFVFGALVPRIPNGRDAIGLYDRPVQRALVGVLYYLPLAVVIYGSSFLVQAVASMWDVERPAQGSIELFAGSESDPALRVGILFVAVVLAPIGEELLFRGLLHGWLRRRMKFWGAAAIGGLVFGLMHVEDSAASALIALPLGVMGASLCWLRERRGGLWACIVFHAIHNGIALFVLSSIPTD